MHEFRKRFVEAAQYYVNQIPSDIACPALVDVESVVSDAEAYVQEHFSQTLSSMLIECFRDQLACVTGIGPSSIGIIDDIIEASLQCAAGTSERVEKKARLLGLEYMQIINSLYPALSRNIPVIQMYFEETNVGGCIEAYASNGKSIMRHTCKCYLQGGSFIGFVQAPKIKPGKLEDICISPARMATKVVCGDRTVLYKAPPIDIDFRQDWMTAIRSLSGSRVETVFNPMFLRNMASGMRAGTLTTEPMKVSVGIGNQPIVAKCGSTEALVMPVMCRNN